MVTRNLIQGSKGSRLLPELERSTFHVRSQEDRESFDPGDLAKALEAIRARTLLKKKLSRKKRPNRSEGPRGKS